MNLELLNRDQSDDVVRCYIKKYYKFRRATLQKGAMAIYRSAWGSDCIELSKFEFLFDVGINIYFNKKIVRPRQRGHKDIMYLKLQPNGLFSLSKLIKEYHPFIACTKCNQTFSFIDNFYRHRLSSTACSPLGSRLSFVSGGFLTKNKYNLWFQLACFGITVPSHIRFPNLFAVFDYETRFDKRTVVADQRTQVSSELLPLSYAINSNLPGFTPLFFVHEDPKTLIKQFWTDLNQLSRQCFDFLSPRCRFVFSIILKKLRQLLQRWELNSKEEENEEGHLLQSATQLVNLYRQLQRFLHRLPVIGFNSQNFDINLIRQHIAHFFANDPDGSVIFKRGLRYSCISNQSLVFLDICNYIAPGSSLFSFLKSHLPNVPEQDLKGTFCYEHVDDYSKLQATTFPSKGEFYSSLKQKHITDEEYAHALEVWNSLPPGRTLKDYLEYYNKLDVKYMVQACQNLGDFWSSMVDLDPWRDVISLPGISQSMLFHYKSPFANILLPTPKFKHIQQMLEDAIVGGPAIIFQRYAEANITKIKEHIYGSNAKTTRSITSYDANSLYNFCLCYKPMPCENWVYFKPNVDTGLLEGDRMHKYYYEEVEWLSWTEQTEKDMGFCGKHHIIHQFNGGPATIAGLPVDGFCPACKTVYCYDGNKFHGPCADCAPNPDSTAPEVLAQQGEHELKRMRLAATGLVIKSICSCKWLAAKRSQRDIRVFCKQHFPRIDRYRYSMQQLLAAVQQERFFGLLRVKIRVPTGEDEETIHHQFPPFFCNKEVTAEMLSPQMQQLGNRLHKTQKARMLVSCLEADEFMVISPLLKYYLDCGFVVDQIYEAIQCTPKLPFHSLGEDIYRQRRLAEQDDSLKLKADSIKLAGNSAYGKCIEQKKNHRQVRFLNTADANKHTTKYNCTGIIALDVDTYEVSSHKTQIQMDTPKIVGAFILGYAKLHMLQFAHLIARYLEDCDFAFMGMDTDSLIVELPTPNGDLDSLVKPALRKSWRQEKSNFFPSRPA